ncbi:MAG TPA: MFS transporter [Jatrophihabitantaceae bacterium]|jgi:MFS family permease
MTQPSLVADQAALGTVADAARSRWTLPHRLAYAHAAAVIGLCLFASVVPSPLYHSYAVQWGFSPLTLTLIFATYAFGVLAALLLVGRVSDQVGRRPVLLAALAVLMLSAVLYIVADGTPWLFVARGIQGLATGAAISTASAALLDLHVRRDPVSVGLMNGVASAAGLGLGSLISSALVQAGTAPHTLPYVVVLVLFGVALVGAYWMPEPVAHRTRFRLTPQRPGVPAGIRHAFLLAALAVLSSWSIAGLFFSIGAQLSDQLFSTTNVMLGAIAGVLLGLGGATSQLLFHRTAPWLGASAGSLGLAVGMVLVVLATATDSAAVFVVGMALAGLGFGVAFLGGLRQLVVVIPPEHRAAVMSAFYVAAYASLSVPAVIAGIVVTHLGLDTTFEVFGAVVAGVALIVAAEAWRTRPRAAV